MKKLTGAVKRLFKAEVFSLKRPVGRKYLQNLGILCGSILLFMFLADGTLRILEPQALNIHSKYPQGLFCKRHPIFGWIGQPNASGTLSPAAENEDMDYMHISMNMDGFWDSNHQIIKPPGIKRILFLGDSFTSSYGVDKEERFTDLIRNRLSSGYEVIIIWVGDTVPTRNFSC